MNDTLEAAANVSQPVSEHSDPNAWTFKAVIEGIFMPLISCLGLGGNSVTIYVLHNPDVKLNPEFVQILSSLSMFDVMLLVCVFFLFSLPHLSNVYNVMLYQYVVPYLYPATNTLLVSSVYMTVCVAVNRVLDMNPGWKVPRPKNGYVQAALVFLLSSLVNVPKWFELRLEYKYQEDNKTLANGTVISHNASVLTLVPTDMRKDDDYILYYILYTNAVLMVLAPTAFLLLSTFLIYKSMQTTAALKVFTDTQEQRRRRRNRNITLMLIGIIVFFLFCHTGEIFIAVYEMIGHFGDNRSKEFPPWVKNIVVVNHLLVVLNSSLNFVIYCKDVVFRKCVVLLYRTAWRRSSRDGGSQPVSAAQLELRRLNQEFGINLQGDPSAEVVLRDLDPQSMILCGISRV